MLPKESRGTFCGSTLKTEYRKHAFNRFMNSSSETAKNCCFYALGMRDRKLWRNCKPFPIHLWNFTNAQWEVSTNERIEKFTNFLGPWSPKSRHSTVREKGVKKNIIYFSTTALKFHQCIVRGQRMRRKSRLIKKLWTFCFFLQKIAVFPQWVWRD